jgi:hypothetical protein
MLYVLGFNEEKEPFETIDSIRVALSRSWEYPICAFDVYFDGEKLDHSRTFADYGIIDGCQINFRLNLEADKFEAKQLEEKQLEQNNTIPRCSITLDPIEVAGITACGSVYGYEAIKEWFSKADSRNRDPLTNLVLPTTFVIRFTNLDRLETKAASVRASTLMWSPHSNVIWNRVWEKRLERVQEEEHAEILGLEGWKNYQHSLNRALRSTTAHDWMQLHRDSSNPFDRPTEAEEGMSHVRLHHHAVTNTSFKDDCFDGAVFENCHFVECGFFNVSMVGATFSNVTFTDCSFRGAQFTLFGSTGTITFSGCQELEFFDWRPTNTVEENRIVLSQRGFDGQARFV